MGFSISAFSPDQDCRELLRLVEELSDFQTKECNYPHELVEGGAVLWLKSFLPTLGMFSNIFLLEDANHDLVGFISVRLKTYPKYLTAGPRGQICEMFVLPACRQQGVGCLLVKEAQLWLKQKGIQEVELNTVAGNAMGEAFWQKMGFGLELKQWSKILAP